MVGWGFEFLVLKLVMIHDIYKYLDRAPNYSIYVYFVYVEVINYFLNLKK